MLPSSTDKAPSAPPQPPPQGAKDRIPVEIVREWQKEKFSPLCCEVYDAKAGTWECVSSDGKVLQCRSSPESKTSLFKIVSCNVLFETHLKNTQFEKYTEARMSALAAFIEAQDAEMFGLQEATPALLNFLKQNSFIQSNYYITGALSYGIVPYGQVLLSKLKPSQAGIRLFRDSKIKRVLKVQFYSRGRTLEIVNIHLTSGHAPDSNAKRYQQLRHLMKMLREGADEEGECNLVDTIIMGDFNFGDGYTIEEDSVDAKFEDIWPALQQKNPGFTFNPTTNAIAKAFSTTGLPLRFDRFYIRRKMGVKAKSIMIHEPYDPAFLPESVPFTDHCPISISVSHSPSIENGRKSDEGHAECQTTAELRSLPLAAIPDSRSISVSDHVTKDRSQTCKALEEIVSKIFRLKIPTKDIEHQGITFSSGVRSYIIGSQRLGSFDEESDIDVVIFGVQKSSSFFKILVETLPSYSIKIIELIDSLVPVLLISYRGYLFEIQYCALPLASTMSSPLTFPNFIEEKSTFQNLLDRLDVKSRNSLQSARATNLLLREIESVTTGEIERFSYTFRVLKRWAKKRGVYGQKFGFLGGVSLTIIILRAMHSFNDHVKSGHFVINELETRESGGLNQKSYYAQFLGYFFSLYGSWDFKAIPVSVNKDYNRGYEMKPRECIAILSPDMPPRNTMRNATPFTVRTIQKSFRKALKATTFSELFRPASYDFFPNLEPNVKEEKLGVGVGETRETDDKRSPSPRSRRSTYIVIVVSAVSRKKLEVYGGWLESRMPAVLIRLSQIKTEIFARPLPKRFNVLKDTGYPENFCIYIKISRPAETPKSINDAKKVKEEKKEQRGLRGVRTKRHASSRTRSRSPPQLVRELTVALHDIRSTLESGIPQNSHVSLSVKLVNLNGSDVKQLTEFTHPRTSISGTTITERADSGVLKLGSISKDSASVEEEMKRRENGSADLHTLDFLKARYAQDYTYAAFNTAENKRRKKGQSESAVRVSGDVKIGKKNLMTQELEQKHRRKATQKEDERIGLFDVPKMEVIDNLLKRFRWDPRIENSEVSIIYHDRFKGLKELSLTMFLQRQESGSTGDFWIPSHRIFYIKMEGKLVWDRLRKRVSKSLLLNKYSSNHSS